MHLLLIKSASNHILFSEYCFSIEGTHAQYLYNIATLSIIVEVLDLELVVPDTEDLATDSMGEGGELAQLLIVLYGGGQGEDQGYTAQHQVSHLHNYHTYTVDKKSLSTVYPMYHFCLRSRPVSPNAVLSVSSCIRRTC